MYKFDSNSFIEEMESLYGIDESTLDYEDYELEEYEQLNERDLRGDI